MTFHPENLLFGHTIPRNDHDKGKDRLTKIAHFALPFLSIDNQESDYRDNESCKSLTSNVLHENAKNSTFRHGMRSSARRTDSHVVNCQYF